jgi:hypothetical protein
MPGLKTLVHSHSNWYRVGGKVIWKETHKSLGLTNSQKKEFIKEAESEYAQRSVCVLKICSSPNLKKEKENTAR